MKVELALDFPPFRREENSNCGRPRKTCWPVSKMTSLHWLLLLAVSASSAADNEELDERTLSLAEEIYLTPRLERPCSSYVYISTIIRIHEYHADGNQAGVLPGGDPLSAMLAQMPPTTCGNENPRDPLEVWPLEDVSPDKPYVEPPPPVKVVKDEDLSEDCSHYTSTHGYECVPYHQCDEDGSILTDGHGLIDVRSSGFYDYYEDYGGVVLDASDKKCPGSLEVCCLDPYWEPTTTTPTTTSTTTTTTTTTATYSPRCYPLTDAMLTIGS